MSCARRLRWNKTSRPRLSNTEAYIWKTLRPRRLLPLCVSAFGLIGAIGLGAVGVDVQRVVVDLEAALFRDLDLPLFDRGIVKLLDMAALDAHQMVVVPALVEFEH